MPEWVSLSRSAIILNRQNCPEQAINKYKSSIRFLEKQRPVREDLIADQYLNIATILLAHDNPGAAESILRTVQPKLASFRGSLLEVRYLRRLRLLYEKRRRAELLPAVQKKIIEILTRQFGAANQTVLKESCRLTEYYENLQNWEAVFEEATRIKRIVRTFSPKMQRRFMQIVYVESVFPVDLQENAEKWGGDRVALLTEKYRLFVNGGSRCVADLLKGCAERLQSDKVNAILIEAIDDLGVKATKSDRERALVASMTLMFSYREKESQHNAALRYGEKSLELLNSASPSRRTEVLRTQIVGVKSVILCKQGDLRGAVKALPDNGEFSPLLVELDDFGPVFTARYTIADEYARRKEYDNAARQYELLAELLATRANMPADQRDGRIGALGRQAAEMRVRAKQ